MQVTLTADSEALLNEALSRGEYQDAAEAVDEALRMLLAPMEKGWPCTEADKAHVREAIEVGWEQAQRGQTISASQLQTELREIIAKARRGR